MIAVAFDIRPATDADVPEIVAVCERLAQQYVDAGEEAFTIKHDTQMRRTYEAIASPEQRIWVAVVHDAIVGVLHLFVALCPLNDDRTWGMQNTFIVEHEHRGQGIGQALLTAGEQWVAEQQATTLVMIYHEGEAGEAWFQRRGFRATEHLVFKDLRGR